VQSAPDHRADAAQGDLELVNAWRLRIRHWSPNCITEGFPKPAERIQQRCTPLFMLSYFTHVFHAMFASFGSLGAIFYSKKAKNGVLRVNFGAVALEPQLLLGEPLIWRPFAARQQPNIATMFQDSSPKTDGRFELCCSALHFWPSCKRIFTV
jgi:hypothetical protein